MAAPIALFVYNRPGHALRTLDALRANSLARESELVVFSDGPRRESDVLKVDEVRKVIREAGGFSSVRLVERSTNMGLANSIIAGVTELVGRHGRVIVLEDDMVTSPHFLSYMNEALDLYRDEERVISVAAYFYPVRRQLPETFFLPGADCWGWGTWKRGWDLFEPDGRKLLGELEDRALSRRFDIDGSYPYMRMLRDQIAGRNDSWAIRWYASAFLRGRLTLYPAHSLLQNIGNDGQGTHSAKSAVFDVNVAQDPVPVHRIEVSVSTEAADALRDYYRGTRRGLLPLARRILGKLRS